MIKLTLLAIIIKKSDFPLFVSNYKKDCVPKLAQHIKNSNLRIFQQNKKA